MEIDMKTCSKCKVDKNLEEFHNRKRNKDGKKSACKACLKVDWQVYKETNPDRVKASNKAYYLKNTEKCRDQNKKWAEANPEKMKEFRAKHYQNNIPNFREKGRLWKKNNPGKSNAQTARRRANRLSATPPWLSEEQFNEMKHKYLICEEITRMTGIPHHVDHIHPLQGKNICGLHVPWNLRIITAEENLKKGNRPWITL